MTTGNPGTTRRMLLGIAAAATTTGMVGPSRAAGAVLPAPVALIDALTSALEKANPLVVMVSLEGCPFCRVARDSYLAPLHREGAISVYQIDMRSAQTVRDFSGVVRTHEDMVCAWRVTIAPTVLFFGAHGKEIVARLEGGYIPDFYGAYLDQRLEQARALIKATRQANFSSKRAERSTSSIACSSFSDSLTASISEHVIMR